MNIARPAITAFRFISSEVRETAAIARKAGFNLSRSGGHWTLERAGDEMLFSGHAVARSGLFDSLSQVRYHLSSTLH